MKSMLISTAAWQRLAVQFLQVWFNLKEKLSLCVTGHGRSFLGGMQSNCILKLVFSG